MVGMDEKDSIQRALIVDSGRRRSVSSTGAAVEKTLALPQLQLVEKFVTFSDPFVFGSHLFGVRLWSAGFWTFLGDDIRKRSRIQRLLVQHWIHVYVSLRRLLEEFHSF